VLRHAPAAVGPKARDLLEVAPVVARQALLRPIPFFAIVSALIGYSVLYVFHRSFAGGSLPLRDDRVLQLIGSRHIVALAPALSGILFAATSANAVTAWLGGLSLTGQTAALRVLGIPEERYLWLPAWVGLVGSFLVLASLFAAGMVGGGTLYVAGLDGFTARSAFELVTAQIVDPTARDARLLARAAALMALYALGLATGAVAQGAAEKHAADAVTRSMVRNVMASTLWIVAFELASLPLVLG
jgi:ABC-type transporter Mla maintaining outer membrane lipid asymmetry permease subunit MlaE